MSLLLALLMALPVALFALLGVIVLAAVISSGTAWFWWLIPVFLLLLLAVPLRPGWPCATASPRRRPS